MSSVNGGESDRRTWWQLAKTCSGTELDRRNYFVFVSWLTAWAATFLVVGWIFPDWGIAWNRLPVHAGWGAFFVSVLMTTAMYPVVLFSLRVLKADDVNLLKQLYLPPD